MSLRNLKTLLKSNEPNDAYLQWIQQTGEEKLANLTLEDWQKAANLLGHNETWAQERFNAWSDTQADGEEDEQAFLSPT